MEIKRSASILVGAAVLLSIAAVYGLQKEAQPVSIAKLAKEVEPIRAQNRVSVETFKQMASEPNTVILDSRSKERYDQHHIEGAIHLDFSEFSEEKVRKLIPDPDTRILIYCDNNFRPPVAPMPPLQPVKVPDQYGWVEEKILVAGEGEELVVTPARYDPVPPSQRIEVIPASYGNEWVEEKILVADEEIVTPARDESHRESRVIVSPPSQPVESIPAKYETLTKRPLVKDTPLTVTPAVYETREGKRISPGTFSTAVALNIPTFMFLNRYGYQHVYELGPRVMVNESRLRFAGTKVKEPAATGITPTHASYEHVDFPAFVTYAERFEPLRAKRILSHDAFRQRASMANTVVLDTRSKSAYKQGHMPGAVHLNFTEFTQEKLHKAIPAGTTQVLFYGNNLESKSADLNTPTFINLMAYGYHDIYELAAADLAQVLK